MKLLGENGVSLLHTLLGGTIAATTAFYMMQSLQTMHLFQTRETKALEVQRGISSLSAVLVSVGRYAQQCTRPCANQATLGSNCQMECIIDPGSGSLLTVAFVSDASKSIVYYHVYDPASNTWPIRIRFVDIASLKICSETEVRNDANNVLPRCDIDPTAPGALNQALVLAIPTAPPDPRFFRFKIEGIAVKGVRTPTLQSSFTLRNPTAFTVANSSNGSISYIKGGN